jgi:hypothetical protein
MDFEVEMNGKKNNRVHIFVLQIKSNRFGETKTEILSSMQQLIFLMFSLHLFVY